MIGLTTSLAAIAGYEQPGGFAIPVDESFRQTVDTLKQGRLPSFGFLGVQPDNLSLADRQAGRFGARVLRVVPGMPAEKAGLEPEDVITHVNDQQVFDRNSLFRELSRLPADTEVSLTIERPETLRQRPKVLTASVLLSKKYLDPVRPPFAQVPAPQWRGLRVEYPSALPPQLTIRNAEVLDAAGCVAVFEVQRDSPAWRAGLRRGDYISHVGERRVTTPGEFYERVASLQGAVRLQLTAGQGEAAVRSVPAE
jgi:serine protease Do